MKLTSEESADVLQSTGQHMSPPSLARPKHSMGTVVMEMGNRGDVDLRLKSNAAMDVDYSPNKKSARPEPSSRIHCIPLLIILVFFILWAGSSDISPQVQPSEDELPELFVMRMPIQTKNAGSEKLKVSNEGISHRGTRRLLNHDYASYSLSKNRLAQKVYLRDNAR